MKAPYRWVNEDGDFKAPLDQALGEAIKAAVLMLASSGAKVTEALMEIIEDKDQNVHARLKAIETYYKYFPQCRL